MPMAQRDARCVLGRGVKRLKMAPSVRGSYSIQLKRETGEAIAADWNNDSLTSERLIASAAE